MKNILILILGMALASGATFAGDEAGKQGGGDRLAKMQQNLDLSDEQVAQLRQIRDNGGDKEQILAVLTDEQLETMKKRRAQMKGKGRKGRHPAPAEDVQDSGTPDG
jgi:Spy/CpxP family protein refolding chaperone